MKYVVAIVGIIVLGYVTVAAVNAGAATGSDDETLLPAARPRLMPGRAAPDPPRVRLPQHGEAVIEDPGTGDSVIDTFQRGKVTAVSSTSMTVRSDDGTTWTWNLTQDTQVRAAAGDADVSDLETGDEVLVDGVRDGDTRTAQYVADPPPDLGQLHEWLRGQRQDNGAGPPSWIW